MVVARCERSGGCHRLDAESSRSSYFQLDSLPLSTAISCAEAPSFGFLPELAIRRGPRYRDDSRSNSPCGTPSGADIDRSSHLSVNFTNLPKVTAMSIQGNRFNSQGSYLISKKRPSRTPWLVGFLSFARIFGRRTRRKAGYVRVALLGKSLLMATALHALAEDPGSGDISTAPGGTAATQPEIAPSDTLAAEPRKQDMADAKAMSPEAARKFLNEDFSMSYSYVGDGHVGAGTRGHSGNLDEQTSALGYGVEVPLSEKWMVTGGLGYSRFDFGRPEGSYLPQNFQKFSLNMGVGYKLSDEWSLFGRFGPNLNIIDGFNIYSNDLTFSGALGAVYKPSKTLAVRFGLAVDSDNGTGLPVMPLLALKWDFAKDWDLNLGLPRTSVDWQILPNLQVSPLMAEFMGGSYHTSKSYGDRVGLPELNDRKLDYTEIRLGAGATYAVTKDLDLNFSVGSVVYRKFDFKDASDASPKVDPAPYVQVGAKLKF